MNYPDFPDSSTIISIIILITKANSKEDYDEIADEIFRLRELRQKTTVDTAARDEQIKRINDLQDYIAQQTTYLTEFDEALVRRWIKQITIWDTASQLN